MIVLPPETIAPAACTRASTATFVDAGGLVQTAAANVLRPLFVVGELRGALIEAAATNLLTQSRADTNSGWGKGTNTTRIGSTTAPDGSLDATIYAASAAGNAYVVQSTARAAATTYTLSAWARLVSGPAPTSGALLMAGYDSNGSAASVEIAQIGYDGLDGTWRRFSLTFSNVAALASANSFLCVDPPVGTQIAIWGAQLEVGETATSYIPTTAAAVTRAADLVAGGGSGNDLLYTNATEPAPAWVSGTSYALGAAVVRPNSRKYAALIAIASSTIAPESEPSKWEDVGAVNPLAMFDGGRNLQTIGPAGDKLRVTIACSGRVDSLFLARLAASYGRVTMTVGGAVVYSKDLTLTLRKTNSWSSYYFGRFEQLASVLLTDLPMLSGATITLELDNGLDAARCASMVIAKRVELGDSQCGASSDPLVFSLVTRDDYGNALLVPRRMAPATSQTLLIPVGQIPVAAALRERLNARAAVWAGMGGDTTGPWSELFLVYGIYTRFKISAPSPVHGAVELDLQEL